MPIISFTGKPGNGKTALMVEHLVAEAKKAERPIFAGGIDGLEPGLAAPLRDPKQWNAVKPGETCTCHDTEDSGPCDAHLIPNGSLIYIDEAWKWFGHLQDAARQQTPAHVLQLAEHRHRGIDFVWTYQQPSQIFPFARGLMADHYHVVRRFGTTVIDVFKWEELQEDVKSGAKRDNALRTTRTLPSQIFGKYKSAEIHTVKARIPMRVLAVPALVLAAILLAWIAYEQLKPDAMAAKGAGKGQASALAEAAPVSSQQTTDRKDQVRYANPTEYARAHLPRFGVMPWTAEIFDGREPTADPHVYCMSSRAGEGADGEWLEGGCTCLTEQGTLYALSEPECRAIARRGPVYNPYQERDDSRRERDEEPVQQVQAGITEQAPGNVISGTVKDVGTKGEAGQPGASK